MNDELMSPERQKVAAMLLHPGTMATILYAIGLRFLGVEMHDWEPETVFLELKDELDVEISPINHDKLMAIIAGVGSNNFYQKPLAFLAICETLSGSENPMDLEDPLVPAEMAWGVIEVKLNDDSPALFSADVAEFVGHLLEEDGFVKPPEVLSFAKFSSKYQGSTYAADAKQERLASGEHEAVVDEYIRDQGILLYRQLSALPWHTEETMSELLKFLPTAAPPEMLP